jgi:hypothetical protein
MRNNKYRGKTKDGHWVYGDLDTLSVPGPRIRYMEDDGCIYSVEVSPDTVGVCLGIYDKSETPNEVCEGDIIEGEFPFCYTSSDGGIEEDYERLKAVITFTDLAFKAELKAGYGVELPIDFMVIGNLTDNPELIEEEA